MQRGLALAVAAGFWMAAVSGALAQSQSTSNTADAPISKETCLGCHGQPDFSAQGPNGQTRQLHVVPERFGNSVHGKRECVECHKDITQIPHQKNGNIKVSCIQCHKDTWETAQDEGKTQDFPALRNVMDRIDHYMRSIHARPNIEDQSRTNATCYNCHQAHYVFPKGTPEHTEWRLNASTQCGNCHTKELEAYATSVHGQEVLKNGNQKAATCFDCHTSHDIESPSVDAIRLSIVKNCGNCHADRLKSFSDTYHGQVTTLGYAFTAKCFDCHGSHTIKRVRDPASTVHPDNRLQTCQKCHVNATSGFLSFEPHATNNDFARYPYTFVASKFMIALLGGTLSFFWLHSALWFVRELIERQRGKHIRVVATAGVLPERVVYYHRWTPMWRAGHLAFAICVVMLVVTGMTLFYAQSFWAPLVSKLFGGPLNTGKIHRFFAVGFVSIFFWHLSVVAIRVWRNRRTFQWFGPYSLIPNWGDLWQAAGMFKWFFGLGPKPDFDRYSYWEKFDYWAPFWGVTIIGVSGAMLWFKELTASFLPGWVFNVATIFHGEEAVLAASFLFTVHFFNNHWRPDNFPLDTMMFTGVMPLEKFKHEHRLEYDRLVAAGELDKHLKEAPSVPMTIGSKILGFFLMACGLILLLFVLIGFFSKL